MKTAPQAELADIALQLARSRPNGEISTTELKQEIPNHAELTEGDLAPSQTRPNELMFHQIIGNIISHRESEGNIIGEGYAEYTGDGIRITDAGRAYLTRKGL